MGEPWRGSAVENLRALAGIDPDESLEAYRETNRKVAALRKEEAELLATRASYRAQFGPGGHFDHERKAYLANLIEARREAMQVAKQKVTEGALDSYAHAHADYREWLTKQARERTTMHELDAQLAMVHAKIEYAEGERELARQRLRLNEEVLRFTRAEAYVTR